MTAIELKYELFRDIESISDESILQKIASYIKTISEKSYDDKPLLYDPESGCYANEETIEAVEESMRGEYAEVADCPRFESFKKSLAASVGVGNSNT